MTQAGGFETEALAASRPLGGFTSFSTDRPFAPSVQLAHQFLLVDPPKDSGGRRVAALGDVPAIGLVPPPAHDWHAAERFVHATVRVRAGPSCERSQLNNPQSVTGRRFFAIFDLLSIANTNQPSTSTGFSIR